MQVGDCGLEFFAIGLVGFGGGTRFFELSFGAGELGFNYGYAFGERGDFFRGALGVAPGDNDVRLRIRSVELANGIAGLSVSSSGDCAGVQDYDIGRFR